MKTLPLLRLLAVSLVVLPGCFVKNLNLVGKRPDPVRIPSCSAKPGLSIVNDVGSDYPLPAAMYGLAMLNMSAERIAKEAAPCFGNVTVDTAPVAARDLQMKVHVQVHNHPGKESGLGFVSGLSLFVVPIWITTPYTVSYEVSDAQGTLLTRKKMEDAWRFYSQILLVVAMPVSTYNGLHLYDNMVRAIFQDTNWDSLAAQTSTSAGVITKPLPSKTPHEQGPRGRSE